MTYRIGDGTNQTVIQDNGILSAPILKAADATFSGNLQVSGTSNLVTASQLNSFSWKAAARVRYTANPWGVLQVGSVVDGVTLQEGDIVFVYYTSGTPNRSGLYVVPASPNYVQSTDRSADMPAGSNFSGVTVFVREGALFGGVGYFCTNTGVVGSGIPVFKTIEWQESRVSGIETDISGLKTKDWKPSVKVLATASNPWALAAGSSVDGVTIQEGDRILSITTSNNRAGIYTVPASPTLISSTDRVPDLPTGGSASGAVVYVEEGTTYEKTTWTCTNPVGSDVVGTHILQFSQVYGAPLYLSPNAVTISGDIETDNTNNSFYFGDSATDGSWRLTTDGTDFVIQLRESSSWNTKQTITP